MAGATSSLISLSGEIVEVMMTIMMIPIGNICRTKQNKTYLN